MTRTRLAVALVVAAALVAAGCGGSDDGSSSTTEWADSLCTEVASWTEALTTTGQTLTEGGLSKESLTTAVDEARAATETFVDGVKELGRPDTEAGQQAQESLDQLTDELESGVQTIESAVDDAAGASEVLQAISVAATTLATIQTELTSALQGLGSLDGGEELQSAFADAESCDGVIPSS